MWTATLALLVVSGLGVNIHTTAPEPGEAGLIRSAGFRTVRMDLHWHDTETRPGHYDWTPYDRLVSALKQEGLRPLLILNYGHPFYDNGAAPATPSARGAFARWAAAAASRYRGQGILWEIYNEPNLKHFWKPEPDPAAYVALARETAAAIRAVAPGEFLIGPAVSGVDLEFLESCFRLGLLDALDAVTVHPYRHHEPESATADYRRLRSLIARYAPNRNMPVFCGEWGYSAAWSGYDERKQALMLTRLFLTNAAARIPLTIWYDWRNDGPSPEDPEHNFGLLSLKGDSKPAFRAVSTLSSELEGHSFHLRLETGRADEFVLLFKSGASIRLVAWTASPGGRLLLLPASPGLFRATGWLGEEERLLASDENGLRITLTSEPVFLAPIGSNANLELAASWDALPQTLRVQAPAELDLATNLTSQRITLLRNEGGREFPLDLPLAGGRKWRQTVWVEVCNSLELTLTPSAVLVAKTGGEPLHAQVHAGAFRIPLNLNQDGVPAILPLPAGLDSTRVTINGADGTLMAAAPETRFTPAGSLAESAILYDGDARVAAEASVSGACQEGPANESCSSLAVRLGAGGRFVRLSPNPGRAVIPEGTVALGAWVLGDASGVHLRLRFADSTGQVFQPAGVSVTWTGWRWVEIPTGWRWVEIPIAGDAARSAYWGGAADGVLHGRLTLDTLLLLDKPGPAEFSSSIAVSSLFWIGRMI